MDAQIGKDIQSSYDNGIMQPVFSVIAQEARDDQEDEFVKILEKHEIPKRRNSKKKSFSSI